MHCPKTVLEQLNFPETDPEVYRSWLYEEWHEVILEDLTKLLLYVREHAIVGLAVGEIRTACFEPFGGPNMFNRKASLLLAEIEANQSRVSIDDEEFDKQYKLSGLERPQQWSGHATKKYDVAMDRDALMWLAGLLEGEGWFGLKLVGGRRYPQIILEMTDEDVVLRAATLMEGKMKRRSPRENGWSDLFQIRVNGPKARSIMRQLEPFMGKRRGEKINTVLEKWENRA